MSLYRWAKDPAVGFPAPFRVGQKSYWIRRDILAFRDLKKRQARARQSDAESQQSEQHRRSDTGRVPE
jgi:hypothetical protein